MNFSFSVFVFYRTRLNVCVFVCVCLLALFVACCFAEILLRSNIVLYVTFFFLLMFEKTKNKDSVSFFSNLKRKSLGK